MYFPEGYFSSQADKLFWERKVTLIFFEVIHYTSLMTKSSSILKRSA